MTHKTFSNFVIKDATKPAQFPMDEILSEDERIARGYMTCEARDADGELIGIDEFRKVMRTWFKRDAPIQDVHTNRKVGKGLAWKEEAHPKTGKPAILLDYQIHKDYPYDDEVWDRIKGNEYTGLSMGGKSDKKQTSYERDDEGNAVRRLAGLELFEVSVVPEPANPWATNTHVNYLAKSDGLRKERELLANDLQKGYATMDVQKPFAGFDDWNTCMVAQQEQGHDKESAERICGWLKHRTEEKFMKGSTEKNEDCDYDDTEKARRYLKPGQKPPKGVSVQRGPSGGMYYETGGSNRTQPSTGGSSSGKQPGPFMRNGQRMIRMQDGRELTQEEFDRGMHQHIEDQGGFALPNLSQKVPRVNGWQYEKTSEGPGSPLQHTYYDGNTQVQIGNLRSLGEDEDGWGVQATTDDGEVPFTETYETEEQALASAEEFMQGQNVQSESGSFDLNDETYTFTFAADNGKDIDVHFQDDKWIVPDVNGKTLVFDAKKYGRADVGHEVNARIPQEADESDLHAPKSKQKAHTKTLNNGKDVTTTSTMEEDPMGTETKKASKRKQKSKKAMDEDEVLEEPDEESLEVPEEDTDMDERIEVLEGNVKGIKKDLRSLTKGVGEIVKMLKKEDEDDSSSDTDSDSESEDAEKEDDESSDDSESESESEEKKKEALLGQTPGEKEVIDQAPAGETDGGPGPEGDKVTLVEKSKRSGMVNSNRLTKGGRTPRPSTSVEKSAPGAVRDAGEEILKASKERVLEPRAMHNMALGMQDDINKKREAAINAALGR